MFIIKDIYVCFQVFFLAGLNCGQYIQPLLIGFNFFTSIELSTECLPHCFLYKMYKTDLSTLFIIACNLVLYLRILSSIYTPWQSLIS